MIFWYANWLQEGSFSTRMTQANTGMTTIPLEERNGKNGSKFSSTGLSCAVELALKVRNSVFSGKRGNQARGWAIQKWLGQFLLEAVELSRDLNMSLFWSEPPCKVWLCLGGP